MKKNSMLPPAQDGDAQEKAKPSTNNNAGADENLQQNMPG
jgi:hypothetical protein